MDGSKKKINLAPQPYHRTLESIQTLFKSKRIGDPLSGSGWDAIISEESYYEMFKDEVSHSLFGNDERMKTAYESVLDNTTRDTLNPFAPGTFAAEGSDALAVNANYNQFSRLNPYTIAGYVARSKVMDLFNIITHDRQTLTYEYNLDYIVKGSDPTKYTLPAAIRDGSMNGLLDLPKATPQLSPDHPHIEALPTGPGATNENWIKIGSSGNLLVESGITNPHKYAIERNVSISKIYYKIPLTAGGFATGVIDAYTNRGFMEGDIANRMFNDTYNVTYDDGGTQKTVALRVIGVINLDTSEYSIAQAGAGYITHFQFDAKITNLANEMDTIRGGVYKFVQTFDVNNKVTGTIPISQLMTDDFNAAGEGVTWTAYMVDRITEAYSGLRDLQLEEELDKAFVKPIDRYPLYMKLGGFKSDAPFVLTYRGAGGGDPFSWIRDGLRDMIRHVLTQADVDLHLESSTPRQWVMYGAERDIQRLPDISYTNYDGETGDDAGANYRYGFAVDTSAGFITNLGQRLKVIGSKDKRRLNKPMVAQLKTMTLDQPTTIYFPYSFRVFSGLSPEYRMIPAICIYQRDYIGTMTLAQARITLEGNSPDLYQKIAKFSASGSI